MPNEAQAPIHTFISQYNFTEYLRYDFEELVKGNFIEVDLVVLLYPRHALSNGNQNALPRTRICTLL
jgi:hypothetical protein